MTNTEKCRKIINSHWSNALKGGTVSVLEAGLSHAKNHKTISNFKAWRTITTYVLGVLQLLLACVF